jgi:hypothetical protein
MIGLVFFGFSGVFHAIIGTRHPHREGILAREPYTISVCAHAVNIYNNNSRFCEVIEEYMSFVLCVKNHAVFRAYLYP